MIPQLLSQVTHTIDFKSIEMEKNDSERTITHYISTPDIDRVRDVLDPKGMDDKEFSETAQSVWYNHNYKYNPDALPIARSLWRKKKDEGVLSKTEFDTLQFASDVYHLHKNGFISTWSVGISQAKDKSGKPIPLRYDDKKDITYWDNWRLLEYSSAPMPANIYAQDVIKNVKDIVKSDIMLKEIGELEFKSEIIKMIQDQDVKLENIANKELELKTLLDAKLLSDLEKSERDILELKRELEVLKTQITKPSGESLGGLKMTDLQAVMKEAVAGELSRITGKK